MVKRVCCSALTVLTVVLAGCGTSGSEPTLLPEVRFEVIPRGGQVAFSVESLVGGSVRHAFPETTVFTATSTFTFFLENAAPPYTGTFYRLGSCSETASQHCRRDQDCAAPETCQVLGDIEVRLSVSGQTMVTDVTAGEDDTATVNAGGQVNPAVTPSTPELQVRLDVCAPTSGGCSAEGDAGTFSVAYSGTAGDPFVTHILSGLTPSIYFLDGARDNMNAVFQAAGGAVLQVQLYVNRELRQSRSGAGDIVVRTDL